MTDPKRQSGSILVVYDRAPAALVGHRRLSFIGAFRRLPPGDPTVRVVSYMAYYAQLVLAGEMPVPYSDVDAVRFARLALIDPDELAGRLAEPEDPLAAHFRVPVEQIRRAKQELGGDA
jgi:hypothetical protein